MSNASPSLSQPNRTNDADQRTIDYLMQRILERYPNKSELIALLRIINNTRINKAQVLFDSKYFRYFIKEIDDLSRTERKFRSCICIILSVTQ
jgi:hypothetical protein